MQPAQDGSDESQRLTSLKGLQLLDTNAEERFDRITRLAARIFSTPICGIGLVDKDRVWYKSIVGLDLGQIQRAGSFEEYVVNTKNNLVLFDASQEEKFAKLPLVAQGPQIKMFAGCPLKSHGGEFVGCFFVADRTPRLFSDIEISALVDMSKWVQCEIDQTDYTFEQTKIELQNKNRELAEEKARQDAMLQNIGDGVIGVNDKGEIIFVNTQAVNLTGFTYDELIGKPLLHLIQMVDQYDKPVEVTLRPIRNAIYFKKNVKSNEFYYVRKDGSKFPVAITASPVGLYGQVVGGVDVFRDVTKEHEVDRMKTEFISLASHQLRTPLSAMKWFAEMLLDGDAGELDQEQKEMLDNIYQSNERMIALVNTLLNISRIESGRIIIEPKLTDLKKLVDEVVLEVQPRLRGKKQNLIVSVHKDLPKINIDPKLVRHVYMNLMTNAIKYSKEGGDIVVMISKSGNEIISQVSDSGFGIPTEQQEKVFTKFFCASNIVKKETDGSGLGLYLTKAIVDSSGGKIWFESHEGKGTTFWFILPLGGSQKQEGEVTLDS